MFPLWSLHFSFWKLTCYVKISYQVDTAQKQLLQIRRLHLKWSKSVTCIACAFRSFISKRKLSQLRQIKLEKRQVHAASILQGLQRGRMQRKHVRSISLFEFLIILKCYIISCLADLCSTRSTCVLRC